MLLNAVIWVGIHAETMVSACAGYPNRFRAGNAASSMWAAQNGSPNNFGAGYNPYIGGRKLMSQQAVQSQQSQQSTGTWVGTDVPSFNGASMGYYQGKLRGCCWQLLRVGIALYMQLSCAMTLLANVLCKS
jgi:hypothetical protein